jgi:hypothetical protein
MCACNPVLRRLRQKDFMFKANVKLHCKTLPEKIKSPLKYKYYIISLM